MSEMTKCTSCGKETQGGVITNGDGFGDAKYVGIEAGNYLFYCWDCFGAGKAPSLDKEIDTAYEKAGMCGFLEAWIGRCRLPKPCPKHSQEKCWKCGRQATKNCSVAGSLVCGMPMCSNPECNHETTHYQERRNIYESKNS